MSLRINSEQQRIEGSGKVATGSWVNATYYRVGNTVTVTAVNHGFVDTEELEIDINSGGATSGNYTITVVNSNNFTFTDAASGTITAGNTLAYRIRRSLVINASDKLGITVGTGTSESSALIVTKDNLGDVRVGINNTNPQYELDVEGQIRTTRSIISDTATIINLDIGTIVNPALNLRAPNLLNYQDTDVTSPTYLQTFFPTADTPPLTDQSRRIATTDFVYRVATNDTGGRVYVSSTIGDDTNDGRSAARPLRTIKKAAQVAYSLQKATPDPSDEYVSIIVSGGDYLEDNPISLPRNCSLIGDNLRRVVVRPSNRDRHMIKASNETYINGVTFRDALQNPNDPNSATLYTWKYAFVFDDKQRLYYEPEVKQIPAVPGEKFQGTNVQLLTFRDNTGNNTNLLAGYALTNQGGTITSIVQSVTFTGPQASPYSTGSVTVLVTSGDNDVFSSVDTIYYAPTLGQVANDPNNPPVSPNAALLDVESLRPELETISNQIYQHTVDSERETILLNGSNVNATTDVLTVTGHGLFTGAAVYYDNDGNTSIPGLVNGTVYYARVLTANTFELYNTFTNANFPAGSTTKQGLIDITAIGTNAVHYLTFGKVMPESNNIYVKQHQFTTGDQVVYRPSKMGAIGGLSVDTTYAVYVENENWFRLATSQANAVRKNPSGQDDPITVDLTSAGKGFQRFDLSSRIFAVATINTSLTTQQTYSGPIINLPATSYHDYEVGQEVNLYGFQSSVINLGASAVYTYTQSGTTIDCTITNIDTAIANPLWANLTTLSEAGLKFVFTTGGAETKVYHCDSFTTGTSFPSLPGGTVLGIARGAYSSATQTIRFRLNAPNSATRSGSFTLQDNIEDLNGRKYVTHRIERADGFSIAFVVRGSYSRFGSALDIAGDQSVVAANNYVLASLRNSPYGFNAVNQTDRYRDGAEAIRLNQDFIAEEAYAAVKSHHTVSSTRGNPITIDGTTYQPIQSNSRSGTYSVTGQVATITVSLGHAGYALQTYSFNWSGSIPDGNYLVSDTPDYRTFTIFLPNSSYNGQTGTVTFTTPLPHVTPGSQPVSDRYADAAALILANKTEIARMALSSGKVLDVRLLAGDPSFTGLTGVTYQSTSGTGLGSSGGFNIGAHYRFTGGTSGTPRSIQTGNLNLTGAAVLWFVAIRGSSSNGGESPEGGEDLVFEYSTNGGTSWNTLGNISATDTSYNSLKANYFSLGGAATAATRIRIRQLNHSGGTDDNWGLTLIGADNTNLPIIPNGDQNCVDDIEDFLEAVSYNLTYGGNDQVYDAANYYVKGAHVVGEELYSVRMFNIAEEIVNLVIRNESWNVTYSEFNPYAGQPNAGAQVKDSSITQDINVPACANVSATIDTFFTILTNAIGTTGSPGNLNGVTRTYAQGDQQCIDDILKVLRAWQYDLRYTGNSATAEAANKYVGAGVQNFIANEVAFSRQVYAYAKLLSKKAINSHLAVGSFSQIVPVANSAITVDSGTPECANVTSALTTLWTSLDSSIFNNTTITNITYPDPVITELGSNAYNFALVNTFLDLPIIEASPYIQNSSLISFEGGSGCEIDGAKVATPNVPRPGLKLDNQGNSIALYDPQGKSMVASAFTIISFGGTAYNILNDGYTQLVSVFAIFCQDGIVAQSGGYASVTNSASNFGTYSLRATGYRAEAYAFDVGTILSVTNQVDGNGALTGRQEIVISGTTLTNIPTEDYIIKLDGYTNTNPANEFIILQTKNVSGTPGSQITATIVANQSLDVTKTSTGVRYAYSLGNIAGGTGSPLVNTTIRLHRPSTVNSSSHTWEFSGSGNSYAALPQNGGFGRGSSFEAREEQFGQVYTSGTNEFGDFKVGNFVTIYNRTGAISFVGTVAISELTSIKITGGDITITGFSADDNLGGAFATDSLLPTQAAVKDYISNNLGPYLNQPYSTNAVPSALVQLTATGKINIDQIPALRPFNITSVNSTAERLALEDVVAGDIAIETTTEVFNVAPADVNTTSEEITITNHGLSTGDGLIYSQGTTSIGNITNGSTYYAIVVNANTIKLAANQNDATNGTAINLTGQGTGTQTFTTQGIAVSYILENDLDSQYVAFTPNSGYTFANSSIVTGSSTGASGVVTSYNDGAVYKYTILAGGSGYAGNFSLTIGQPNDTVNGIQAAATANVVNGSVVSITITNLGKGYYTAPTVTVPTSPTGSANNASIGASVEGRIYVDIANNIKFDTGDFLRDGSGFNLGTGTYSQTGTTTLTVTESGHGLTNGNLVYLNFTSGTAPDGFYVVSVTNANEYTVTTQAASTTSGNVERERTVDLLRVVNTSASDAANWTQLTSTNIDATNIVSGTIDPQRLASRGVANAFTFLRGDSSYEYALQSIKPETADAIVINASITDSTYIESVTIVSGGTGYNPQSGAFVYQNLPLAGGNVSVGSDNVARASFTVTNGVITAVQVTDPGTGYNANFTITVPSELGAPATAATLTAVKGTVNRGYGNISIDVRKANPTTTSTSIYGNYGISKFRKRKSDQALANQTEAGFIVTTAGEVRLDQGSGSGLIAEFIEGATGRLSQQDLINASLFTTGSLDPARIAQGTYNISINGESASTALLKHDEVAVTSNPAPSASQLGIELHLRNNSAVSLSDGGTQAGILTYRRKSASSTRAVSQLGFTDNNNLWIRGDSGGGSTTYSSWYQIWSSGNDGASSGLDADLLDGRQGLWYQSGHNIGDRRGHGTLGDPFIPEVLGRDKYVLENFYVASTGSKFKFYIPNFHVVTGPSGNITNGGTFTMYEDANATQNIGTIIVDANGASEQTGNDGAIYSTITGTCTFTAGKTGSNVYLIGPSASGSTRWTVTSSNELVSGSAQLFAVNDNATGVGIELGQTAVSSVPTFDFRSSGLASDYDVQFRVSGGTSTNGAGTLRINAGDVTINGNTVWHSGNDGSASQLDARYLQGAEPSETATNSSIVKRTSSGDIAANDFSGDQITLTNTGTSILNLADANGITVGKAATNSLSIKGKGDSNSGYIRFGNDTKDFGWNGTYLNYDDSFFRNQRIGIGQSDPQASIDISQNRGANGNWMILDVNDTFTRKIHFAEDRGAYGVNQYGGYVGYDGNANDLFLEVVDNGTLRRELKVNRGGGVTLAYQGTTKLTIGTNISTPAQIVSSVATGTAPFSVLSTTVVTNLNADLLDGYSALTLPYLGGSTNTWISSTDGQERFFFANNGNTFFRTGDDFYWRNDPDQCIASLTDAGTMTLGGNNASDYSQTTYALEARAKNGININAAEALSSGQKTTVLYATGDKQWIDTYGIFKRNRQTVSENVIVANGDNCMSAGPITIASGTTVTLNSGGYWSIV